MVQPSRILARNCNRLKGPTKQEQKGCDKLGRMSTEILIMTQNSSSSTPSSVLGISRHDEKKSLRTLAPNHRNVDDACQVANEKYQAQVLRAAKEVFALLWLRS